MLRIGACAVADVVALHFFTVEIDEVEPALGRMHTKICNADNVAFPDGSAGAIKLALGNIEQFAIPQRALARLCRQRSRQCWQSKRCARRQPCLKKIAPFHSEKTTTPSLSFP